MKSLRGIGRRLIRLVVVVALCLAWAELLSPAHVVQIGP
jgi:hypothetical protein